MIITVLMDNHTEIDVYHLGEPAVSYWLEADGKSFLFDAAYSDAFLKNAAAMDIDLTTADAILISHGHNDHTGGLAPLLELPFPHKPKLVAHPDALLPKKSQGMDVGSPLTMEELSQKTDLCLTKHPLWLTERLVFLGEIPPLCSHEPKYAIGTTLREGQPEADYLADDTALAYVSGDGFYLITGCSHAGICNMIAYAKEVTGLQKAKGLLGGFHLFALDDRARKTIDFIENEHIPLLYPCHCTSFAVRAALHQKCPLGEVGVGMKLDWE
ncbi:MBL fold metallo-hydrolase [Anaerotignum lactatifermentans]|uniref:MBL fold metallo-hydrolase n=1 Tax=Anaerotignum lactatifermentans TaxID=160404 RepID=A0ABS2GC74_9FIRM|nr:MBL fold metallo-hydrolase [Anaerotignum lactatifermentans]MBM6830233.1 MBL fold metallo-hydrolase [Anaerotignum lactatifermentans]MBM6878782.1 MBL fold metallo-hydrolase [Anaerotignum lactatifermentans]MBM6951846.1 MBL fold metallo-hydrolase [Anaerotignum lactatifermentans]